MYSKAMGGRINPYLLSETPSVLSIGRHCMEEGYSFIWNANELPYLVTPTNACISLKLDRNIPYLDTRDDPFAPTGLDDAAVPVAVADAEALKEEEDGDQPSEREDAVWAGRASHKEAGEITGERGAQVRGFAAARVCRGGERPDLL
jgi:hypothetical protein